MRYILAILLALIALFAACGAPSPNPHGQGPGNGYQFPTTLPPAQGVPIFNVRTYGAVGDGVTDDRVAIGNAITAACNAATPAIVFFPAGTYVVSRNGSNFYSLNITCSHLTLQGVPYKSAIMQPSGMPNAPVTVVQLTSVDHVALDHLIIDGNWENAVGYVSSASDGVALPASTINLVDVSFFPSGGGAFTVLTRGDRQAFIFCTGKNASTNQLTGCVGGTGTLYTGMTIGYVDAPAGINQTTQSTAIAALDSSMNGLTLPQASIVTNSSTAFVCITNPSPCAGVNVWVKTSQGYQLVSCTVTNGSATLTACTGGTGTLSTGGEIFTNASTQGRNPGIGISSSHDIEVRDVTVQRIYGDCIDLGGGLAPAENIRIINTTCNIASRDGIAFSSSARAVTIDNFRAYSVAAQAIDGEPVAWPIRNVVIQNSIAYGWWNTVTHGSAPLTIGGGSSGSQIISVDARNWRVRNNTFYGAVIIGNATDVVFDGNRVFQNYANDDTSPIWVSGWTHDVTISDNTVYTRSATSGTEGQSDCCGILVTSFLYAGGAISTSTDIHVLNNKVHVRNGRFGIVMDGVGQVAASTTGTATATGTTVINTVTFVTLTDSTATWTASQWIGGIIKMGGAVATIQQNTACPGACTLTLNHVISVNTNNGAWFSADTGDPTETPALGAYTIAMPTGVGEVADNFVDGNDSFGDPAGKGKYCYVIGTGNSNTIHSRVRVHHNVAKNCDTNAFQIHSHTTNFIPYVELTDNFAYDDQPTPTTTNVVSFLNAPKITKFVMGRNQKGEGVTNLTSGLSSGTWQVEDGVCQDWAGYGSPLNVVTAPICARYFRVDGGTSTTLYVKESGTGASTGWVAK